MRIFRSAAEAGKAFPGPVVTIGKFDAMHVGHRKVIQLALKRARTLKTGCVILTFDPAPEQYLKIFDYRPVLPLALKLDELRRMGVDGVLLLAFDEKLACLTPEAFVRNVLETRLKPVSIFVGEDFCFGKDRAGNLRTLEELGQTAGFTVHGVPLLKSDGAKITSERVRGLLDRGQVSRAARLLGRKLFP